MTAIERLTVLFVLCGCLSIAVLYGDQTRAALTVGGVATTNLGEHTPGVELAATVTRGPVESQTIFDLTQKIHEPGLSRVFSQRLTAHVGPVLGGVHVSQRLGAWKKATAWYVAGLQHAWASSALAVNYRGELAADNQNNTRILEATWRTDRGAARIEFHTGCERYTHGAERRTGCFQVLRVGKVWAR